VAREYFIADAESTPLARTAKLEKALADKGVEAFALRAEGLSEESLQLIIAMVDRMRAAENLGDVDSPSA
jgi:thiamine monophosphate synthase